MPTTRTVTTTIVEFTKAEADTIISAHIPALTPQGAQFERGRISFELSQQVLADALKAVIPDLPAQFSASQVGNNPNVALRVTFVVSPT